MSLLNLENVPGNMVSGLGTDELEWVTTESSDRFVFELDPDFLKEMNLLYLLFLSTRWTKVTALVCGAFMS